MGALDPRAHKSTKRQNLPGPLGDGTCAANDAGPHIQSSDEFLMDLWPSLATLEDYFSTIIASLAPSAADRQGTWKSSQKNPANCSLSQIDFLQDHEALLGFSDKVVEVYERALHGVTYSVDM